MFSNWQRKLPLRERERKKFIYINQMEKNGIIRWRREEEKKWSQAGGKCDFHVFGKSFFFASSMKTRFRFCRQVLKDRIECSWKFNFVCIRSVKSTGNKGIKTLSNIATRTDPNLLCCVHISWPFTNRKFHYLISISHCYFCINIINQITFPP